MKKILSVLITISLAITLTNVNVFANEKSENIYTNNSMNLANNDELRVLSEEERIVIGKKVRITKYETNIGILETILTENLVTVRDGNGEIVFATTYYIKNDNESVINVFNNGTDSISLLASGLAESYDRWRSPITTSTYVVTIGAVIPTIQALSSAIKSILAAACPFLLAYSALSFASDIYSAITENIELNIAAVVTYNFYCNILVKEKVIGEIPKYSLTGRGSESINWLDSPWIYGVHPEACRYLTEIY